MRHDLTKKPLKLNDRNYEVWGNLGDAYYWSPGERLKSVSAYSTAIKLGNEQLKVNPRNANLLGYIAAYYAMVGQREQAMDYIRRALVIAPSNSELLFSAALVYKQFGKNDDCLQDLAIAISAGMPSSMLKDTPNFDDLHNDERFQELVAKSHPAREVSK